MGFFIAIDGIDGAGNTTHSRLLVEWLQSLGLKAVYTMEPSDSDVGLLIRTRILSKKREADPRELALLFAADRIRHSLEIGRLVEEGYIVVSDRYVESSIAYQSAQGVPLDWILEINKYARKPDLQIILDVEPEIAIQRKGGGRELFERVEFLRKVREVFKKRARENNYPVVYTGVSLEEAQSEIRRIVANALNIPLNNRNSDLLPALKGEGSC